MSLTKKDEQNKTMEQAAAAPAGHRMPTLSPPTFSGKAEDWNNFIKRFEWYRQASGLSEMPEVRQISTLMYIMGPTADDLLLSFNIKLEEETKYKEVFEKLNNHFLSRHNKIHARAKFNKLCQESTERIDDYISRTYSIVELCRYPESIKEELIRDRIIVGIRDIKLSNDLQLDQDITLTKVLAKVRQAEEIERQQKYVRPTTSSEQIDSVQHKSKYPLKIKENIAYPTSCGRCGKTPSHPFYKCPAKSSTCTKCTRRGHWAQKCRNKLTLNEIDDENQMEQAELNQEKNYLGSISDEDDIYKDQWKVVLRIQDVNMNFKIDSGADVSAIGTKHLKMLNNISLDNTKSNLRGAAKSQLNVKGKFRTDLIWKNKIIKSDIFIIENLEDPLLGKPAIENFGLLTRINEIKKHENASGETDDVIEELNIKPEEDFPQLFKGLGKLKGQYKIVLVRNTKPYAISCPRRLAIPLYKPLKDELKLLQEQDVIFPVDEPTEYCAGIVVRPKENGNIRLCVDYTELNKNICRSRYQLPSVEECLAQIGSSRYFSKLDANKGYFQLPLDEESKLLTTFITPFGRYAFNRMPMGIACASEVYQKKMHSIIEGIEGVINCQDDILISGITQEEHNRRLHMVLSKMVEEGVTLNKGKCKFAVEECNFLGHIISKKGVKPCPNKIKAIIEMPSPSDITTVRSFMGMINYHLKFLPNLANITKPIRDLLKIKRSDNNKKIQWTEECENVFKEIKSYLVNPPTLTLFDPNKKIRVSADASSYGLGGVIEQFEVETKQWKPLSYASRSLTPTEMNYAQIEKEALALTWACEKFAMYLDGLRNFELRTDHQPLTSILGNKAIADLTARLQRFRLRLSRFSYEVKHVPGKFLHTADVLSRAPLSASSDEHIEEEKKVQCMVSAQIQSLPISDTLLREIQKHQENDDTFNLLKQYTQDGWPQKKIYLDDDVRAFYTYRGELGFQNNLLMKGHRIVIPGNLRNEMLKRLHQGHLGIEKCRNRARESIWWPGISSRIKIMVEQCPECIQQRINCTQPLIPMEIPKNPWEIVAVDLFTVKNQDYMLTIDYFSRYPEVTTLRSTTSRAIITHLKVIFARFGIPKLLKSDNGPQFDSEEFRQFSKNWGFQHVTSSPHAHWSNGMAEAGVKIVKNIIIKSDDPILGLMAYRSTPTETGHSPAQLLFGRRIRTMIPIQENLLNPQWPNLSKVKEDKKCRQLKTKWYYDKHHRAREVADLFPGVRVWDTVLKTYAIIIRKREEPRSYDLRTDRGSLIRRNIKHLIRANESSEPPNECIKQPAQLIADQETNNSYLTDMFDYNLGEKKESDMTATADVDDTTVDIDTQETSNYVTKYGRTIRPPLRLNL